MARHWKPIHTFGTIALVALASAALKHEYSSSRVARYLDSGSGFKRTSELSLRDRTASARADSNRVSVSSRPYRCGNSSRQRTDSDRGSSALATAFPTPPPPLPTPTPKTAAPKFVVDAEPYRSAVARAFADLAELGLAASEQSIVVLDANGRPLASHNGTLALDVPAAAELASTLAHLQTWSPQHRFVTRIYTTGTIRDGVLYGDLWIRSSYPTDLVWEASHDIAVRLQERGLRVITGNLTAIGPTALDVDRVELQPLEGIQVRGNVRVSPDAPTNAQLLFSFSTQPLLTGLKQRNTFGRNAAAEILASASGHESHIFTTVDRIYRSSSNALEIEAPGPEAVASVRVGKSVRQFSTLATASLLHQLRQVTEEHQLDLTDILPTVGRDADTLVDRNLPHGAAIKAGVTHGTVALAGALPDGTLFVAFNRGPDRAAIRAIQDRFARELASISSLNRVPN
ncbi:MAG: D-alanyl-D-alanine carboxypeptidase [Cyanobacteria bacterium P01_D01_bin.123]